MLSTVTAIIAFIFSLVALVYSIASVRTVAKRNARSISLKEIAILSGEVTDLKDAYASLLAQHKRLRSRIGMRENRDRKVNGAGDLPDSLRDPDGYKKAMRLKHLTHITKRN